MDNKSSSLKMAPDKIQSNNLLFSEKQAFRILIILGVLVLFFPLFPYFVLSEREIAFAWAVFSPVMAILLILANFAFLKIEITEQELGFGYGIIKKKFKRAEVLSCEPFQIKFRDYWGYGIRYGINKTTGWITRSGAGVRIKIRDKKRDYVLSTDHADEICAFLKPKPKEDA